MRAYYRHEAFLLTTLELSRRADVTLDNAAGVFRADYLAGPKEDVKWRMETMDHFRRQRSETFRQDLMRAHPELQHVRIVTCYHTCENMATALAMCSTGFVALADRDEGYFGRGFYLSPDLGYSADHYHSKDSETATVICCDVVVRSASHTTRYLNMSRRLL
jgi:hypothetical protein